VLAAPLPPHDSVLGLAAGGMLHPPPATIRSAVDGLSRTGQECGSACAGGLLSVFHLNINRNLAAGLADVKAQIRQDRLARAERMKAI